jgi:adenylyltransferase/sulfurtransferase
MKEITPIELKRWMDEGRSFQLIDIREPHEIQISSIGGEHIPMGQITDQIDRLRKDIPVVIYCRSGSRSAAVIRHLEAKAGLDNLYNLKGGLLAYASEVDPALPRY